MRDGTATGSDPSLLDSPTQQDVSERHYSILGCLKLASHTSDATRALDPRATRGYPHFPILPTIHGGTRR